MTMGADDTAQIRERYAAAALQISAPDEGCCAPAALENSGVFGATLYADTDDLADANKAESGLQNVEFRKGDIAALPLDDARIGVVISNCVINLTADKP